MPNPRDDLAALLDRVFDEFEPAAVRDEIADAILARWRLVPVEEGCAGRDHQWGESAPVCIRCGYVRTFSAMSMEAAQRTFSQRRAADELTHYDQTAGHYGDTCQCGEGAEHSPRTHP